MALRGTPGYLAPEQVPSWVLSGAGVLPSGEKRLVDARVDIYALGVIFYETLAGVSPYPDGSNTQIIIYTCTHPPVPLSEVHPQLSQSLPPGLETLIYNTMSRDPGLRPQSAAAFLEQLNRVVEQWEQQEPELSFEREPGEQTEIHIPHLNSQVTPPERPNAEHRREQSAAELFPVPSVDLDLLSTLEADVDSIGELLDDDDDPTEMAVPLDPQELEEAITAREPHFSQNAEQPASQEFHFNPPSPPPSEQLIPQKPHFSPLSEQLTPPQPLLQQRRERPKGLLFLLALGLVLLLALAYILLRRSSTAPEPNRIIFSTQSLDQGLRDAIRPEVDEPQDQGPLLKEVLLKDAALLEPPPSKPPPLKKIISKRKIKRVGSRKLPKEGVKPKRSQIGSRSGKTAVLEKLDGLLQQGNLAYKTEKNQEAMSAYQAFLAVLKPLKEQDKSFQHPGEREVRYRIRNLEMELSP